MNYKYIMLSLLASVAVVNIAIAEEQEEQEYTGITETKSLGVTPATSYTLPGTTYSNAHYQSKMANPMSQEYQYEPGITNTSYEQPAFTSTRVNRGFDRGINRGGIVRRSIYR